MAICMPSKMTGLCGPSKLSQWEVAIQPTSIVPGSAWVWLPSVCQPPVGVAPARVVLTAELIGGLNDFEEYYCPTVSWEWGDDTKSESTVDCEPYEAGKSEIKRRFTVQHVFQEEGSHKVFFRLKRRNKEVAAAWVNIQVRPGVPQFDRF